MLSRLLPSLALVAGFYPVAGFAAERPVVVELYTSQGCSSCPPANAYLNELSKGRRDVLPLAFHVTYWDRLGWKDPYSLQAATDRQDQYGHRFGDGSYTPEIVVDGAAGLVGSHRSDVGSAIEKAKQQNQTAASVSVTKTGGEQVAIQVGSGSGTGRNPSDRLRSRPYDSDRPWRKRRQNVAGSEHRQIVPIGRPMVGIATPDQRTLSRRTGRRRRARSS